MYIQPEAVAGGMDKSLHFTVYFLSFKSSVFKDCCFCGTAAKRSTMGNFVSIHDSLQEAAKHGATKRSSAAWLHEL